MSRSAGLLVTALLPVPGGAFGQVPTQRLEVADHQTVAANDAGRAYVQEARTSVFHSERAVQAARAALNNAEVILRVGKSPYGDPFLTSTLLSVRLPLFPKLKVELTSGFSCDLVHEVLSGRVDLALVTEPPTSPIEGR